MNATTAPAGGMPTVAPPYDVRPHRRTADRDLSLAVSSLHAAFRAAALPLDLCGVAPVRAKRAEVITQVDDYLLPRLEGLDAPVLVVVGGPTGAGKSTLVNSLTGRPVTTSGLLRPTTRSPVLVHHPADREWFGPDRVLPSLDRVDRPTDDHRSIQLVASTTVPRGLALLDAPDFDSIDDRNRELATKLLAAADLLLFVTSAARYSDQVPWQQLSLAIERDTAVAVVLNRIPPEDKVTVSSHLAPMLRARKVAGDRVFHVEQARVDDDGLLPADHVSEIRAWLAALAADTASRSATVRQTVGGAVRRAIGAAGPVADAAGLQVEAVSELLTVADRVYAEAADALRSTLSDGTLMRGDLLVRWFDLLGRPDVPALPDLTAAVGDLLAEREPDLAAQVDRLGLALDMALETLLVDHAERAAGRASRELRATAYGSALLDWSSGDLSRPGRGLATRARKAIRASRQELVTRVGDELAGDAADLGTVTPRLLAVALTLRAVASPPIGPEAGVPGLLVAARTSVVRTLTGLLAEDRDRYLQPVLDWHLAPDAPGRLRAAARDTARALDRHERQRGWVG